MQSIPPSPQLRQISRRPTSEFRQARHAIKRARKRARKLRRHASFVNYGLDSRRAIAEAAVIDLARLGDELLQALHGLDEEVAQALRNEARQLFSIAHSITRALAYGDVVLAYRLCTGSQEAAA